MIENGKLTSPSLRSRSTNSVDFGRALDALRRRARLLLLRALNDGARRAVHRPGSHAA